MDKISIIDTHAHPVLGKFADDAADKCLKAAFQFNVKKLCVMGNVSTFGEDPTEKEVQIINDNSIQVVKKHHDNFIGFCFLNPKHDKTFIFEEAERCIAQAGFRGIKLWVSVKANDKKLSNIMEVASKFGIPVLQHTWYKSIGNRQGESSPSDIAYLASRYPNIKIIMGHLGGCGMRGVLDIEKFSNVYVETGGSQPATGILEFAVRTIGPERVLFGSDTPCRSFPSQLGRIYGADISDKSKKMILAENAKQLLDIK
jgi:predicted TIM-barrel fold metal-dependent hydrolase